ncbi:hypothetical protein M2158_002086 [Streptomyces sp. SAI-144]|uniref:hypothetical protein n=1 Tax=Streptomyces sp. SAI-144 TaxID=2940544 RepID=UPI0024770C4A|nr:hypothetical protein [Streptomyces sp. SAI-144]MDH6433609.1 hypothetical protein [Streptomyces sp. SAI-144]
MAFLAPLVFRGAAFFAPAFSPPARVLLTAAFFATLFAAAPTAFTALAAAPLASPPESRAWVDRPDADCCTAVFFATMPRPLHIL